MPCERADWFPVQDAAAQDVDRRHLAAPGVGDVRVASVGMSGRVSRLAEAAQHVFHPQGSSVDDAHRADVRMRDDRDAADGLDAPRVGKRSDVPPDAATREVDDDEARFEIRGHEGDA
ncbi:MAG: hypothetical protein E6G50_07025 [Actinobacteria bacterium]|nr:MAG: hypothetical protein E6G50_07025 [Actinomycetota bacterium]